MKLYLGIFDCNELPSMKSTIDPKKLFMIGQTVIEGMYYVYFNKTWKIKESCMYENCRMNGEYKSYYKKGGPHSFIPIKNGLVHGTCVLYNRGRWSKKTVDYFNGLPHGSYIEEISSEFYYNRNNDGPKNTKKYSATYTHGILNGVCEYFINGVLRSFCIIDYDEILCEGRFNSKGKCIVFKKCI